MTLQHREVMTVEKDGERIDVHNKVNVEQTKRAVITGLGGPSEKYDDMPVIGAGGTKEPPEAVTQWVADGLARELNINILDHSIDVIDVEADDVKVVG